MTHGGRKIGDAALLMTTWSDSEAELVRQILAAHDIPCQVVSDVPHTVLPLSVDGLGEVRLLVPSIELERAKDLIAQHRRDGMRVVEPADADSEADDEPVDEDGADRPGPSGRSAGSNRE